MPTRQAKQGIFEIEMNRPIPRMFDAETNVFESLVDDHDEVRLWLRLHTCTKLIERQIRKRLRKQYNETLPRFDLMAQLRRTEGGMTLSEASKRMMVSPGNVTMVVGGLVQTGHVERRVAPSDKRSQLIKLTSSGRAHFRYLAAGHQRWISEMLGDLKAKDMHAVMIELAKVKRSVSRAVAVSERANERTRRR